MPVEKPAVLSAYAFRTANAAKGQLMRIFYSHCLLQLVAVSLWFKTILYFFARIN